MVSPLPTFLWLAIGLFAQWIYPSTKLNVDNVSITTLQFGLVVAFFLSLLCMAISVLYTKKPNDNKLLVFLFNSSKQFADLTMGVAGFSSAYFFFSSVYWLPFCLIIAAVILSTSLNHIFLVVFDKKETGTYKWALKTDEIKKRTIDPMLVNAFAAFLSLSVMLFFGVLIIGWLAV